MTKIIDFALRKAPRLLSTPSSIITKTTFRSINRYTPVLTFKTPSYESRSSAGPIRFRKKVRETSLQYVRNKAMADPNSETATILQPFQDSVKELGDLVRKLKLEKAPENDIKTAVT